MVEQLMMFTYTYNKTRNLQNISNKASNILFGNNASVPFWMMQGLLAQWAFRSAAVLYPGMSILFLFRVSLLWISDLFLNFLAW